MKKKIHPAMRRSIACHLPDGIQDKTMDWDIFPGANSSNGPPQAAIQFSLKIPGHKKPVEFALTPEDAYDLREDIAQAYDQIYGI